MKLGELRALTLVTSSAPPASGGQERHPSFTQTLLGTKAALDAETETHTEHDRALGPSRSTQKGTARSAGPRGVRGSCRGSKQDPSCPERPRDLLGRA